MTMRLYDTARRAVVPFDPPEHVLMYTCGITPYDATHLGHAATFLAYDVLHRRLIDLGHRVTGARRRYETCEADVVDLVCLRPVPLGDGRVPL